MPQLGWAGNSRRRPASFSCRLQLASLRGVVDALAAILLPAISHPPGLRPMICPAFALAVAVGRRFSGWVRRGGPPRETAARGEGGLSGLALILPPSRLSRREPGEGSGCLW